MQDEIKVNRVQPTPLGRPDNSSLMSSEMRDTSKKPSSKMPWFVLGFIVVVLVVLGVLFRDKLFGSKSEVKGISTGSNSYQAVFLTNGQVYFGKISNVDGNYITLNDIYYLQVVQQPPLQGTPAEGQQTQPDQKISLVKLGQELHGPVDEMHINRAQVLFYEDLKQEGNVVAAILKDKADKAGQK